MSPAIFRAAAVIIAIIGVIDPTVTSTRRSRPEIAVLAHDDAPAGLAERVASVLGEDFTVVRGPYDGAAAIVSVGSGIPDAPVSTPVFAVLPPPQALSIQQVAAPHAVSPDAQARVAATVRVTGSAGRTLETSLRNGALVLDRVSHQITGNDERVDVALSFAPAAEGSVALRIESRIAGGDDIAAADIAIDVRAARHAILFFDHRPSWQSTFIRRALDDDPRFYLTSRVITSRNISMDAGRPPAGLADTRALDSFDVIVVGAAELLRAEEVSALDAFMRRRGGTVVLLLDHSAPGPYQRLAGIDRWSTIRRGRFDVMPVATSDTLGLKASEMIEPATFPAGASPLAVIRDTETPVVWRSAVGPGRLVVSGVLDAWRFRDPSLSSFETFWRDLIATEAAGAPDALEISLPDAPLLPGSESQIVVSVRDAMQPNNSDDRRVFSSITSNLETATGRTLLRLWPDAAAGRFRGTLRVPREPGTYRIVVTANGVTATRNVIVADDAQRPAPDQTRQLAGFVASRGGLTLPAAQLDALPREIARVVRPEPRPTTWHPLRSAWWIVPFTILLGIEWWLRRNLTASPRIRNLTDASSPTVEPPA